ncbi:glycosyltransferase family 4 protein [Curtobacterium ammoniigenes]|uniref:glycosyltransferase family 4 protein n=1 Tax=Curtobacterium ammoniigenes TaxID=395387 RepID=UPI000830C05A|nr:glycosyltransferase family 4 protein [Curtobacterium ammoniigenes]
MTLERLGSGLRRALRGGLAALSTRTTESAVHVGILDMSEEIESIQFTGWAENHSSAVETIVLRAEGKPIAVAETGLSTPSVAASSGLTTRSDSGWKARVPRSVLGPGTHSISVQAVLPGRGVETVGPVEVEIVSGPSLGFIDLPRNGETVAGSVVTVRGWFRATKGFDRVDLYLGDAFAGRARILANPRPDLAEVIPDVDAGICGFEAWLDAKDLDGELVVRAEAVGPGIRVRFAETRFTLEAAPTRDELEPGELERIDVLAHRAVAAFGRAASPIEHSEREVLVTTHHLGIGGGQLWLHELMLRMLEQPGIRFRVLSSDDGSLRDELEALGVEVQVVGYPPTSGSQYEQWLRGIAGVLADRPVDIVLSNTAGSFWGVDAADRLGVPSVWAIHESFSPELFMEVGLAPRTDAHVRSRFMHAFETASAVVFEADSTLELFDEVVRPGHGVRVDYGVDLAAVETARSSADAERARRTARISPKSSVLLCVGTYEARKAQALLTVAFSRLAPDYPNAVLALVGYNGTPYAEEVVELVRQLDVQESVVCVPTTPDIYDWYALADAFVLASDVESLPRSMIEAMAFGLPIIGTDVFGVGELVHDRETGMLFAPSSLADAERALRRFLDLGAVERQEMGDRAQAVAELTRSSKGYATTFRALIDALVDDPTVVPSDIVVDGGVRALL